MNTQDYLSSVENKVDALAKEIRSISQRLNEQVEGKSSGVEKKTKELLLEAEMKVENTKNKIREYGLRGDLAYEEVKGGLEMAAKDLKETFKSIKNIIH